MSQINFQDRHRKSSGAVMKRFITLAAVVRLTSESGVDTFTVQQIRDKIKDLESVNPEMVNGDGTVGSGIRLKGNVDSPQNLYSFYCKAEGGFRLYLPRKNPNIDPSWK